MIGAHMTFSSAVIGLSGHSCCSALFWVLLHCGDDTAIQPGNGWNSCNITLRLRSRDEIEIMKAFHVSIRSSYVLNFSEKWFRLDDGRQKQ